MRKTTLLLALMLILTGAVHAQVSAYSFAQTSGTYNEFTDGTTVAVATDNTLAGSLDNFVYEIDIPFDFYFNGSTFIACNASTNGFLTFGGDLPSPSLYSPISNTGAFDGVISAFAGDLNTMFDLGGRTGDISTKEIGTAPARKFVIQYRNWRPAYTTSTTAVSYLNFQIVLSENGAVQIVYGPSGIAVGTTNSSATRQIGLRGSTNTDYNNRTNATTIAFDANTAGISNSSTQAYSSLNPLPGQPSNGLTYTWTPPSCVAPTGVMASNITTTTATLSFNASQSAPNGGYDVFYSTSSTAPAANATPTATIAGGSLTTNITGLTSATTYYVFIRSNCGAGDFSNFTPVFSFNTLCDAPSVTAAAPAAICGQGTTTITATSDNPNAIFNWYSAATGGDSLFTGNPFTTPSISSTTTYYAEAATGGSPATLGPLSPTAEGGAIGNQTVAWEVKFTVTSSTTLQSIDIFPGTSGVTGAIAIRSSTGTVIETIPYVTTVGGGATAQTIPLNYSFAPGDYQLYPTLPAGGLTRNTSGATYPYTSAVANITGNGYDATYYMGFYNWKFGTSCASPRVAVVATVNPAPAFTLSATTVSSCAGAPTAPVTITAGTTDYQNFVISPLTGVTGNAADGYIFNPTVSTMYTLTATQTAGLNCAATATVMVNVNPIPTITISPIQAICGGTTATITATTTVSSPGSVTIGDAATLTGATSQPTAFCNRFEQYWNQTVYTAAELTAAGMQAGAITSIAYNITTIGDAPNVTNFSIRIGNTTADTSPAFVQTGLDVVYGPSTYSQSIGVNVITFTTPYMWDGISNILVDVRQDGVDLANNAITYYTATTANMTRSAISSSSSATTPLQSTNPAGTTSLQRLNVVFGAQVGSTGAGTLTYNWSPGNFTGSTITVTPAQTTTYTLTATDTSTGCSNTAETTVIVTSVDAPTGDAAQTINADTAADATIEDIEVVGSNIMWYASAADAAAGTNPLPAGTLITNGSTYYATQTVGGCTSVESLAVTVDVVLATKSFGLVGLDFYPNPTTGMFNITYSQNITNVSVYNMIGQEVKKSEPNAVKESIDLSGLPTGTYLVKVSSEGKQAVIKVLKN